MSILDSLKELLSGAHEEVKNIAESDDVAQSIKDTVTEHAEGITGRFDEEARNAAESAKDALNK